MAESLPRQSARTRRFTLGRPRNIAVAADGSRIAFLRSRGGDDPVTCLWAMCPTTGEETLVADPLALGGAGDAPTAEERLRRERARDAAAGITSYSADPTLRTAAFAVGGSLYRCDLGTAMTERLDAAAGAYDPRLDVTGRRVAYVAGGSLRVRGPEGDVCLAADDDPNVTYGLAEFVAAEEMGRSRGHWWSPDGTRLAVARVDTSPVARWYVADPARPASAPSEVAYPAAGTANADVELWIVTLDGERRPVEWDRGAFPYLARVVWNDRGPLVLMVQSRDQRTARVIDGDGRLLHEATDGCWVDLVDGVPDWVSGQRLVTTVDDAGARRLTVGGEVVTPPELQVRSVLGVDGDDVLFSASEAPEETHVHSLAQGRLSAGPGVHSGTCGGGLVVVSSVPARGNAVTRVVGGPTIRSVAETPVLAAEPTFHRFGPRALSTAVLLPHRHVPGTKLPVLMDPYGGPHAQRAVKAELSMLSSQWLADQGFAVVVADGRGTPGRGPAWERAVWHDLAGPVLEDQVDALEAAAAAHPDLDLGRVGIRGWSFGGYLAALAVLRRPDVFHAAVAGAPVTDWRLYDTHYTERYLGLPSDDPEPYDRCSLLVAAPALERPLLLVHGLADDNVFAAHTLQLSQVLLEAGRAHTVLPLPGVTHSPPDVVAENLLLLQVEFLRRALQAS